MAPRTLLWREAGREAVWCDTRAVGAGEAEFRFGARAGLSVLLVLRLASLASEIADSRRLLLAVESLSAVTFAAAFLDLRNETLGLAAAPRAAAAVCLPGRVGDFAVLVEERAALPFAGVAAGLRRSRAGWVLAAFDDCDLAALDAALVDVRRVERVREVMISREHLPLAGSDIW